MSGRVVGVRECRSPPYPYLYSLLLLLITIFRLRDELERLKTNPPPSQQGTTHSTFPHLISPHLIFPPITPSPIHLLSSFVTYYMSRISNHTQWSTKTPSSSTTSSCFQETIWQIRHVPLPRCPCLSPPFLIWVLIVLQK